jgi:hypothetical protein
LNANDLLFWLSARREGSWQQFRGAVEELHLSAKNLTEEAAGDAPETGTLPLYRRLQFNLQRLAHVEFFAAECENGWRVAPPVLGLTRGDEGWIGLLCGARLPTLLDKLTSASAEWSVEQVPQEAAPDVISLHSENVETAQKLACAVGAEVQMEPCRAILTALPAIDDPQLLWRKELPAGGGWIVHRFSVSRLAWQECPRELTGKVGLGLFRFTYRHQREYVLCQRGGTFGVQVQVAKFLLLKARRRRHGILRYDHRSRSLRFNVVCHPPPLMDRALTLCSGQLPAYEVASGMLSYEGVSRDLALLVSRMLRQEIA